MSCGKSFNDVLLCPLVGVCPGVAVVGGVCPGCCCWGVCPGGSPPGGVCPPGVRSGLFNISIASFLALRKSTFFVGLACLSSQVMFQCVKLLRCIAGERLKFLHARQEIKVRSYPLLTITWNRESVVIAH